MPYDATLWEGITADEKRIVAWVVQSWSNKEIAGRLGLTSAMVEERIKAILAKLKVENKFDLLIYVMSITQTAETKTYGP